MNRLSFEWSCSIIIIVLAFESSTPVFITKASSKAWHIIDKFRKHYNDKNIYINKEGRDEHGEEKVGQKNKQNSPHRF